MNTVYKRERYTVTEKKFIQVFNRRKKAFLQDVEKGRMPKTLTVPDGQYDHKKVLDWFERWLKEENVPPQKSQPITSKSFEEFIDEVLYEVKNLLSLKNINIICCHHLC